MTISRRVLLVLGLVWLGSLWTVYWAAGTRSEQAEPVVALESPNLAFEPGIEPMDEAEMFEFDNFPEEVQDAVVAAANDEPEVDQTLLRYALDKLMESAGDIDRPEARLTDEELMRAIALRMSGSHEELGIADPFGGVFYEASDMKMAEAFMYIGELTRRPDKGISVLDGLLNMPTHELERMSPQEQELWKAQMELAKDILQNIDDPRAFRSLLEAKFSDSIKNPLNANDIKDHVDHLTPEHAREFAPAIHDFLMESIERGKKHGVPNIAAQMYFTHDSRKFYNLLFDDITLNNDPGQALRAANDAHTLDARRFLRHIAAGHRNEKTRNRAQELLNGW